ncbi:MAG: hypothetical protein Q9195_008149 [Heterodermia aff. obscurata]
MPPSTWYPIYELLTRHGVDHDVAKAAAINDLRAWELPEIAAFLQKVQRPSRDYCYFRDPHTARSMTKSGARKWWSAPQQDTQPKWISPPRTLIDQSASDKTALCINEQGQWSLRASGYVALSHVWIEGLQRDKDHNGVNSQKVDAIFALLRSRSVQAEWIWTDVLVIPSGGDSGSTLEDEMVTLDVINNMPHIYSRADAVIIIDAMLLQLHSQELIDVALGLACGNWATRVWTYQEIKLANRALVLTANGAYDYKMIVDHLQALEDQNYKRYHKLWLHIASMMKDDARGISIPDIVVSCGTRRSGQDVDYARAFFPVLGLKWEYGMTREEGMQKIYTTFKRHSSRVACFYGAPRMSTMPAWAPSAFNNLQGYVTEPMSWEQRGIRGDWFAVRVEKVQETFTNAGRFVFEFALDCSGDKIMQCACAPNEDAKVSQAFATAVERGNCYVLSAQPSVDVLKGEFARTALLVERAQVNEADGFEAAVFCTVIIPTRRQHTETRETVLLRHWSPTVDGDLQNQLKYMWHVQEGNSQPSTLPRQEGESKLHAAVRAGDLSKVIALVETGERIDSFDSNGWTPLHVAAGRDNGDILRYLLCQTPDVEIRGTQMNEDTPLSFAALNGQANSAEILLEFGANIHTRNKCNYTPIMVAACERHDSVVKSLIEYSADPNDAAGFSGSALLLASGPGKWRLPTLRALIQGGADVNPPHPNGFTPLHQVAEHGDEDEMAYLLEQGCKADASQWNGITPLFIAIKESKRECVRLLLNAGADRNKRIGDNYRPVHYAAKCPNWQIMQMLLEKNDVELNAQTESQGSTALHIAYAAANTTVIKILLHAGANPNIRDANNRLPGLISAGHLDQPFTSATINPASPPLPPRPSKTTVAPPLPPRLPSSPNLPSRPTLRSNKTK